MHATGTTLESTVALSSPRDGAMRVLVTGIQVEGIAGEAIDVAKNVLTHLAGLDRSEVVAHVVSIDEITDLEEEPT